jgi:hypothetical protein
MVGGGQGERSCTCGDFHRRWAIGLHSRELRNVAGMITRAQQTPVTTMSVLPTTVDLEK